MNTIEIGTKIEFNTGRQYSENGQIIKAVVIAINEDPDWFDEYVVLFHDTTRGIIGQVEIMEFSEAEIVDSYDRGWYTNLTCSEKEFDRHFNEASDNLEDLNQNDFKMEYFKKFQDKSIYSNVELYKGRIIAELKSDDVFVNGNRVTHIVSDGTKDVPCFSYLAARFMIDSYSNF